MMKNWINTYLELIILEKMSREEKQIFIRKAIKKITALKDGYLEIETTYSEVVDKVGGATRI